MLRNHCFAVLLPIRMLLAADVPVQLDQCVRHFVVRIGRDGCHHGKSFDHGVAPEVGRADVEGNPRIADRIFTLGAIGCDGHRSSLRLDVPAVNDVGQLWAAVTLDGCQHALFSLGHECEQRFGGVCVIAHICTNDAVRPVCSGAVQFADRGPQSRDVSSPDGRQRTKMVDMAISHDILRLTAFSSDPAGGNPAGVLLDARGLDDSELQSVAAEVGYAETAFLIEPELGGNPRHSRIRYFSPIAEVPFCGHATIATAIALTERDGAGTFTFETPIGPVSIDTATDADGRSTATFTSVEPSVSPIDHAVLTALLGLIGIDSSALDVRYPAMLSYAGNTHPIVVLQEQAAFDEFTFDPVAMRTLMDAQGWAGTVTFLHPLDDSTFEARNLFPVGNIVEDPATGSAAASAGGYLRKLEPAATPRRITIHQGRHVGRPSVLEVDIPVDGGISVTGTAVPVVDGQ